MAWRGMAWHEGCVYRCELPKGLRTYDTLERRFSLRPFARVNIFTRDRRNESGPRVNSIHQRPSSLCSCTHTRVGRFPSVENSFYIFSRFSTVVSPLFKFSMRRRLICFARRHTRECTTNDESCLFFVIK